MHSLPFIQILSKLKDFLNTFHFTSFLKDTPIYVAMLKIAKAITILVAVAGVSIKVCKCT
jgi:hypothetical protein